MGRGAASAFLGMLSRVCHERRFTSTPRSGGMKRILSGAVPKWVKKGTHYLNMKLLK